MALHMVRSLGQAFDVCHKLNPKPKKKKPEEEGDEDSTGEDPPPQPSQGEVATTPDTWKQFSTDLDVAMDKLSVQDKQEETKDLTAELDFDPFASPPPPGILGNGLDPFQPPLVHPPLAVGNTSSLPYFPEGIDPATVTIPPAHLHLLTGPPQPNGQVSQCSYWHDACIVYMHIPYSTKITPTSEITPPPLFEWKFLCIG